MALYHCNSTQSRPHSSMCSPTNVVLIQRSNASLEVEMQAQENDSPPGRDVVGVDTAEVREASPVPSYTNWELDLAQRNLEDDDGGDFRVSREQIRPTQRDGTSAASAGDDGPPSPLRRPRTLFFLSFFL